MLARLQAAGSRTVAFAVYNEDFALTRDRSEGDGCVYSFKSPDILPHPDSQSRVTSEFNLYKGTVFGELVGVTQHKVHHRVLHRILTAYLFPGRTNAPSAALPLRRNLRC